MDSEEKTEKKISGKSTLLFVDIISVVVIIIYLLAAIFYFFPNAKNSLVQKKKTDSHISLSKKKDKESSPEKEKPEKNAQEEALKKIENISYFSYLYANKDFKQVPVRLGELIDNLRKYLTEHPVSDFEQIRQNLTDMTDHMEAFITENHTKIREKEKELLAEKLENLKTGFYTFRSEDFSYLDGRIDRLIDLLKKKNETSTLSRLISEVKPASKEEEAKTEKPAKEIPEGPVIIARKPMAAAPAPRKTSKTVKPASYAASPGRYNFNGSPPRKTVLKTTASGSEAAALEKERNTEFFSVGNIITTDEIKPDELKERDRVFGKTLCVRNNRKGDTTHFLSNQVLIKLVDVDAVGGLASLDITHPRQGLRRFADMETGTRRPFEFGRRIYFFELLKTYRNCADVAIYEKEEVY